MTDPDDPFAHVWDSQPNPLAAHLAEADERVRSDPRVKAWAEEMAIVWGPAPDLDSIRLLMDRDAADDDRMEAAHRLAPSVAGAWRLHRQTAVLMRRAVEQTGESPAELKVRLVCAGLFDAASRSRESQSVRLGETWVKGPDGKQKKLEPENGLGWPSFLAWLRQATYAYAERWLEEEYPEPGTLGGVGSDLTIEANQDAIDGAAVPEIDEDDLDIDAAGMPASLEGLTILERVQTPQQRRIVEAFLLAGHLPKDQVLSEVARIVGISRQHVDVQWRRLRAKALEEMRRSGS